MAGLPKSIIAKYGVSKKAWAVFRSGKRKRSLTGGNTMGKRKSKSRRSKGGMDNLLLVGGMAIAYGALRPKVEQVIAPYTAKIPFAGQYADELALGTVGYLLAKGKIPYLKGRTARSAGKAIFIVEATRVGSGLSQQFWNK